MIQLPILWQFVALLVTHFVADFVCQTHWQASNKSKDNDALGRHVASYTAVLAVTSIILFGPDGATGSFVMVNGALHFATDYFTSRWSSRHFGMAIRDTHRAMSYADNLGVPPDAANMRIMGLDPGRHYHNFFVVIGLDQLIHGVTLAATLWWLTHS